MPEGVNLKPFPAVHFGVGRRLALVAVAPALGLALLAARGARARSAGRELRLEFAGRTRSAIAHVPPSAPAGPLPLVLVLHGGGGRAQGMAEITGFDALADRERFLVVYPNGTGPMANRFLTWNAGWCCGPAKRDGVDDVGFLRALVDAVDREHPVDRARVFATGLSNGAMMSYRLACEAPDLVAAVAPVAGALDLDACRPSRPVSVIAFNGTADPHVSYDGGPPKSKIDRAPRSDRSAHESVGTFAMADGCKREPVVTRDGTVTRERWTGGARGTEVVLVSIAGEGHTWPGGRAWARLAATPTKAVDATAEMWRFFRDHPRVPANETESR